MEFVSFFFYLNNTTQGVKPFFGLTLTKHVSLCEVATCLDLEFSGHVFIGLERVVKTWGGPERDYLKKVLRFVIEWSRFRGSRENTEDLGRTQKSLSSRGSFGFVVVRSLFRRSRENSKDLGRTRKSLSSKWSFGLVVLPHRLVSA